MATFAGTTQKCKACEKTVYLVDELTADNKVYHKACFRCHHCKGTLKVTLSLHLHPHPHAIAFSRFHLFLCFFLVLLMIEEIKMCTQLFICLI